MNTVIKMFGTGEELLFDKNSITPSQAIEIAMAKDSSIFAVDLYFRDTGVQSYSIIDLVDINHIVRARIIYKVENKSFFEKVKSRAKEMWYKCLLKLRKLIRNY